MIRALASTTALAALLAAGAVRAEPFFNRIAAFPVPLNLPAGAERGTETSAEIVDASGDGMMLVYSDSPQGAIGFIDIADPAAPKPLGSLAMAGEPTSVAILGQTAFVGVNTSETLTAPAGRLATVDLATRAEVATCDLGGQPDSVALAPDGSFLAIAIENERDEDLNDGEIPQMPAGYVAILPIAGGAVDCAGLIRADVTGLAQVAPTDPEPEFVDINGAGEIAVTLQENNHVAILDRTGKVIAQFSAGAADLDGIDTKRDGALRFTEAKAGVRREPDAIKWIGNDRLIVANEGDYEGGSRGFTLFTRDGEVAYESGASFERAVAALGHYPEGRSGSKGVEPEGLEIGRFGGTDFAFVLAERASVVGVYTLGAGDPVLHQILPSGVSPEGAVAIPARGLLITANEVDLGEDGLARSHVMIYRIDDVAAPAYPTITSQGSDPLIGWGALSGLVADAGAPGTLYAVSDSVYAMMPTIYTVDATQAPARITAALPVTRQGAPAQKLDIEGIALDGEGGFWLASEGRSDRLIPHALFHVNAKGAITQEIPFPPEILSGETRFGAEGVARNGTTLWIAIQREWGDDAKGEVKLLAYDTEAETWGAVRYPLERKGAGWMGLSEITIAGAHAYIIERDNLIGEAAVVKRLYRVALGDLAPAPLGGPLPLVTKELVRDLLPDLAAPGGYIADKVEGFTIDAAGDAYAVTDNDGVDDSSGETHFLRLGKL